MKRTGYRINLVCDLGFTTDVQHLLNLPARQVLYRQSGIAGAGWHTLIESAVSVPGIVFPII